LRREEAQSRQPHEAAHRRLQEARASSAQAQALEAAELQGDRQAIAPDTASEHGQQADITIVEGESGKVEEGAREFSEADDEFPARI